MVISNWYLFFIPFIILGSALISADLPIFTGTMWLAWTNRKTYDRFIPLWSQQFFYIIFCTSLGLIIGKYFSFNWLG